jgi:hypothetical protein
MEILMHKTPPTPTGIMVTLSPKLLQILNDFPQDIAVMNAIADHEHYSMEMKKETIKKTLQATVSKL